MPPRKNSWLVTDGYDAPVHLVATRTIRTRLEAVWAEVLAAVRDERDAEAVHRLRVATRRTLAALESFDDLLPPKRRAWFVKRLRHLRQAAGEARDLDVLALRLASIRSPAGSHRDRTMSHRAREARDRLVGMLARQRTASRRPIRDCYEELIVADWAGHVERLLERITVGRQPPTFGRYAARRFRPLVERFFDKADRKLRSAQEIHELRIEGKKLRYALEILSAVFSPATRARCQDALERLQKTLGDFTDHAAAADRFRRWSRQQEMSGDRAALAALRRDESRHAREARKLFVKWWNASRRRTLRRTFENSLRRATA
jgi:CHAD domain-containing protein